MLETVMWPAVSYVATRRGYWSLQDGAKPHTAGTVLEWVAEKFVTHVISNLTDRVWPPKSPDLSPMDYWFWGISLLLLLNPSASLMLIETVNEFAALPLTLEEIRKVVNDILSRASACFAADEGAFEGCKFRKHRRDIGE